ncbi:hypothetical protein EON81_22120 [bacterium]|nr:MAG: hypothetical protein EON81_22120 [bacterium]
MPVTKYRTLNGRMRGQTTAGTRTDYLTDALGSVTATVTASAVVENTYRHKPYGQPLSKTGTGIDPRFLWTGDTGSRTTGTSHAEQYNRLRHYGVRQATWTAADPLWPSESPYGYVGGGPTTTRDRFGLSGDPLSPFTTGPDFRCGSERLEKASSCCASFRRLVSDKKKLGEAYQCVLASMVPKPKNYLAALMDLAARTKAMDGICSYRKGRVRLLCPPDQIGGNDVAGWPTNCPFPCNGEWAARMLIMPGPKPMVGYPKGLNPYADNKVRYNDENLGCQISGNIDGLYGRQRSSDPCVPLWQNGDACVIAACENMWQGGNECRILLHEMFHCTGLGHLTPDGNDQSDYVYSFGKCFTSPS